MVQITTEQVEHVARLARLRVSEEEKALFAGQLSKILEYVEQLKAIGTEGVDHTASGLDQPGSLRDDEVRPSLSAEAAAANAPVAEGGTFLVPKVIQER
jgi:aspartyl-tRNA(Asn)/glutamyl-tRNA(Gln) amidotransferase subunit C